MNIATTMPIRNYASLGRCVFCLDGLPSSELTDEHIIPRSLNGSFVLKGGACNECARYGNRVFEQPASNADFLVPRLLLELRRRKKSEKKLPLIALGDHTTTSHDAFTLEVQAALYPPIISFVMVPVAGLLAGVERTGELTSIKLMDYRIPSALGGEFFSSATTRHLHNHTAFALSLAKMAYCYGVGELGLDGFDGDDIRDLIMGRRSDTYNFVGGLSKPEVFRQDTIHGLYLRRRGDLVTVVVHILLHVRWHPMKSPSEKLSNLNWPYSLKPHQSPGILSSGGSWR